MAYRDCDEKALSCLQWSRDGRRIAVGDSEGFVSVWQADKDLYLPKISDFDLIDKLIQKHS
jgi:WD40 repeat protein